MDKHSFLLLIFLVFQNINAIPIEKGLQSAASFYEESCISFRVGQIPIKVNKAKNNENYLNVRVEDELRLMFNSCNLNITCVVYRNNRASTTLASVPHDSDGLIIQAEHDSIRCTSPDGFYRKFHIFANEYGKFFKYAIINETSQYLSLVCLGGTYTTDVTLIENGQNLDVAYDPFIGFLLDKTVHPPSRFYQCQFQDERISFNYPEMRGKRGYEMGTIKYTTSMMIQCKASEDFMNNQNTTVILACPDRTHCPVPTLQTKFGSSNSYTALISNQANADLYRCVFLKNGELEAIALDESDQMQVTNLVLNLLEIGSIIAIILFLVNTFCRFREKREKNNKFTGDHFPLHMPQSEHFRQGHSSTIILTKYKPNGRNVIIKSLQNPSQCQKELYFFKKARHANIIDPLGYINMPTTNRFFNRQMKNLVLPYYQNTCLENYIKQFYPAKRVDDTFYGKDKTQKEISITLFDMVAIGWQISSALEHLKKKRITHRDVAMRNVLITDDLICKLTDFERAKKGETEKISVVKKLLYSITSKKKTVPTMYPRECADGAYYYATEVYCFGLLLLEMFQFVKSTNSGKIYQPMHCPSNIYDIITDCLKGDRQQRIDIGKCESELKFAVRNLNIEKLYQLEDRLENGGQYEFNAVEQSPYTENSDYRELDIELFN